VSPFNKQGTGYVTGAITPCTKHHTGATGATPTNTSPPNRTATENLNHHPHLCHPLTTRPPKHCQHRCPHRCIQKLQPEGTSASLTTVFHYHHSLQHHSLHLQHHSLHHPADHPPATTTPQITHLSELHRTCSSQNQTAKPNIHDFVVCTSLNPWWEKNILGTAASGIFLGWFRNHFCREYCHVRMRKATEKWRVKWVLHHFIR